MAAPSIAIRRHGARFLHEILSAQRAVAFSSASRHYMYVVKEDAGVLQSPGHPDLGSSPPATTSASTSRVLQASGEQSARAPLKKRKRLSAFDVSQMVVKRNIKTRTELLALAEMQKREGKTDLAEFVVNRGQKCVAEAIEVKTSSIFQKSTGNDERVKQLMGRGLPKARAIPGVKNIIVIASGKGGVGKSTVAVNLALSVSHLQKCSVGLLDADVFGPSIPRMLNLSGHQPEANKDGKILPLQNYGLSCMSMGFLVDEKSPIVWRGLMVMQAIQRLLFEVAWGNTEYLFIDMPPGTGDTQLSISQLVPVSGAVIVSTPQDIALLDARKGAEMFKKVNIPVLGLIQNMSIYHCPNCGHQSHIFGQDGVRHMAQEINVDLLGEIPLHMDICQTCDQGKPISISAPSGQHATIFNDIAKHLMTSLRKQEKG